MHSLSSGACHEYHEYLRRIQRRNFDGKIFYHLPHVTSWMVADDPNTSSSNVHRLVQEVYANEKIFPPRVENSQVPLFSVLLHKDIQCGHMFHIFQKQASQDFHLRLENLSSYYDRTRRDLESEGLKLPPVKALSDYEKVIEAFDRVRWSFSPVSLNLNTSFTVTHASVILPFCYREVINDKGGTASVYLHGIEQDLVEDTELRKALEPSKCWREKHGSCYQLAVKSYMEPNKAIYDIESEAFRGIRNQPGVVQYLGEYRLQHPTIDSPSHHIMLEYGEMDLDEYLAETYPPVLNGEIKKFWEELFSVARTLERIHNLQYDSKGGNPQGYRGWHGDIKPDNLLRVRGNYKLSDFGFAKFERRRTGNTKTFLLGGTRTYGAPECDFSRYETRTPLSQTIDTWSFGCVLSSVATWVVLGSQAYESYNERRKIAIEALKTKKATDTSTSVPSCEDAFHDGKTVLPAVTDWHVYLRNSARRADTTTHRVLDLVDNYMLVPTPEDRSMMGRLCEQLDDIILLSDHEHQQGLEKGDLRTIRPETLAALQELDNKAPLRAITGQDVVSEAKIRNNDGYEGHLRSEAVDDNAGRPNKQRKSERFEKIVFAKTANRVQKMPPLSESPIQLPEGADIKSDLPISKDGKRHKDIPILRLDSSEPTSAGNLSSRWQPQEEPLEAQPFTTASPENLSPMSLGTGNSRQLPSQSQGSIAMEHSGKDVQGSSKPSHEHFKDDRPEFVKLTESAVVETSASDPELNKTSIFREHATLKKSWDDQKNSWRRLRRVPEDRRLKRFISNRDVVFVVDNAYSMLPHWDAVKTTLLALAMKIGSLDKDGLDLIYTCGNDKNVHAKGWDIPKQFEQSLDQARSIMNQKDKTDIQDTLTKRFDSHAAKGMSQRQTLVILTNGLWEGSSDWESAATEIAKYIDDLRKRLEKRERRWFTIQFISYGQNPKALERLQKLDDVLRGPDGKIVEDIVDTKPWYFDNVDSLILGSINEAEDKETADVDKTGNDPVSAAEFREQSPPSSPQALRGLSRRTSGQVSRLSKLIGKER